MEEPGDSELVRRLREGDTRAFEVLFERYRRSVLAFLTTWLGDHAMAEDVTQETFVELARRAESLDPKRSVKAWLFRVARNRAVDWLRRRREMPMGEAVLREVDRLPASPADRPDAGLLAEEASARIRRWLAVLPESEREVLRLRFVADLKFREIAMVLNRPLGTVLWQTRSGLRKLRKELES